ncbi:MAG: chemotaxis protein CheB [Planctomycetota bacterium]
MEENEPPDFVVGIGASAGGLEAIERLFDSMPVDTGMAFVVVQHLSPDYKSLMNEVLARWTAMPILQVADGMRVERNSIYLIPPKKEMIISDSRLLLTDKDPDAPLSLPIDRFFRSLGQDVGRRAVAVVLSGTGSDGSRGVADVHEAGGLVIVQSAGTAKFDGMPRMAEHTGVADLVVAPEEMPDALQRYARDPRISLGPSDLDNESLDETGLKRVFTLIRDGYGLDFSHYKLNTVVRRTERRLLLSGSQNIDDYVERLRGDPEELNQLYRDLLIGVTRFFRDIQAFDALQTKVIADLVDGALDDSELRVWVAGCATGEEAYSLAILLDEAVAASGKRLRVKIFATDVHVGSLEFAGHGVYPEVALGDISTERMARYFKRTSGGFHVSADLRQMIVFAPHNLVKDAPFTKLDLISCRNMLIYLQPQAQQKVLSLFHFGLKTGGSLLLGPSESVGEIGDEFDIVESHWRIFRKRRDVRLPTRMRLSRNEEAESESKAGAPVAPPRRPSAPELLTMSTYDALLEAFLPPSLLVSDNGQLLHTFGDAGKYLQPERGRHSADVRDRLIDGIRTAVTTAISKVLKSGEAVSYSRVSSAGVGDKPAAEHDISASLIRDPRSLTRSVLVQIQAVVPDAKPLAPPETPAGLSSDHLTTLESELRYTKENLQSTIEQLETSNEELQATNEELVASNEELQSTNEELHSVNEELYTVNAEHQNKIIQLSELTRDMDNLLESTEVDTVFLDAELRIRKFTPGVAQRFNFLPQDIGRRFDSFTHSIQTEGITEKVRAVVTTGRPHEEEVRDHAGNCFLMRILPYQDTSAKPPGDAANGALVTLIDITKLTNASDALAASLRQRDNFLAMLSHELRNPLATILNATHLLAPPASGTTADGPAEIIKRQSRQMATLLDDLLDVTRVSQGKIHLQRRPFNLLPVIERAAESVALMVRSRGQSIVQEFNGEPVWVFGSEPRIQQVATNLLTNASKYSGDGEEIYLSVEANGGSVEVHVRDCGVGIAPEQIDRVFELFVQADRTLDRADGGLGVGLTLVKSLVELHGGEVTVHSDGEGRGSDFCVRLPTCDEPAPAAPESDAPSPPAAIRRLTLVEDNLDASKMLAFLLEDAGYEVTIAHDGNQGLELIRSTRPDAAIIDVGLPGMNGYELAQALRSDPEHSELFLVAVTGYGQEKDRREAAEAGFDEHLVKPVDPAVLNRLLSKLPSRERVMRLDQASTSPSEPSRSPRRPGLSGQATPDTSSAE